MKLRGSKLIEKKVKYTIHDNQLYFAIEEIRQYYPFVKFPPDKIRELPIGGVPTMTIRAEDVEPMTDFDRMMMKTLNYNPNK